MPIHLCFHCVRRVQLSRRLSHRKSSASFHKNFVLVEVQESASILFSGMIGSRLPIVVAHGEGQVEFTEQQTAEGVLDADLVTLRYVDHYGQATETYPMDPNGSPLGITGFTSTDGRFNIMMPHPERLFRTIQHSWHPDDWGDEGPWLRLFRNARVWLD